jgi:hypothetical protein
MEEDNYQEEVTNIKREQRAKKVLEKKKAAAELQRYSLRPAEGKWGRNPLLWWAKHKDEFPWCARLARRDLAVFGSQAAVERIFSLTGRLCSKLRARMHPATVARLARLQLNHELI